ncbi:MAG: septal ring lytic transglycosylase RlpA family protein [Deltaproteobacteria bacterium]|jgi:rare lipoprotein A|nr:septal ring lytic transglycosylase RlpA family protein [Deltaproteobacteria bacterium]
MFGFRLFRILGMAMCLGMLYWGHAAQAAAPVPPENAPRAQVAATAAKRAKSPQAGARTLEGKSAPAKASPQKSTSAAVAGKGGKRGSLPPASADLPQSGIASWVGKSFHGKPVANPGERYVMESFTAAHRAIAFHTILKVTDMRTGRSVLVRVNDRGPYIRGRIVDLAKGAAEYLGFADRGITAVRLDFAGNAKDPAQRYYIRMLPDTGRGQAGLVRGFGPFDTFDEAAALFMRLYTSCPDAELLAVREKS